MRKTINLDDTRFIFTTNFSGDPERDKYRSTSRRFNVIVPDEGTVMELVEYGVNVKYTRPNPDYPDDTPTPFVTVKLNFDSKYPPRVYLIAPDGTRQAMTAETVGNLDYIRIKNVCVKCNLAEKRDNPDEHSLYADIMYVEQDAEDDPYYARYVR